MNDLPKGWEWRKLGEICDVKKGTSITKSKITDGAIPVIAGGQQPAYYHNVSNRNGKTITVSASGAYAGFVNYFEIPIFASDCTTIQSLDDGKVLTRYIFLILKSLQKKIYEFQTGAGQPHVYAKDLVKLDILVPPLSVQKRTVEILEHAQFLKQKRKEADDDTNTIIQSIFNEMFGDIKDEKSIQWLLDNNYLILHKDGNHGGSYPRSSEFGDEGVAFISAKNIDESGLLDYSNVAKLNETKANQLKIGWIEKGDVLLAHNATVGKVGLYNGYFGKALIGTSLTAFRPNTKYLSSEYLFQALRSTKFQSQLTKIMGQTTRNQVPITSQKKFTIKIPSIQLQNKFAEIVQKIESLKEEQEEATFDINNLFDALMQKAFNGELVE